MWGKSGDEKADSCTKAVCDVTELNGIKQTFGQDGWTPATDEQPSGTKASSAEAKDEQPLTKASAEGVTCFDKKAGDGLTYKNWGVCDETHCERMSKTWDILANGNDAAVETLNERACCVQEGCNSKSTKFPFSEESLPPLQGGKKLKLACQKTDDTCVQVVFQCYQDAINDKKSECQSLKSKQQCKWDSKGYPGFYNYNHGDANRDALELQKMNDPRCSHEDGGKLGNGSSYFEQCTIDAAADISGVPTKSDGAKGARARSETVCVAWAPQYYTWNTEKKTSEVIQAAKLDVQKNVKGVISCQKVDGSPTGAAWKVQAVP